jgi:hypothetical protein
MKNTKTIKESDITKQIRDYLNLRHIFHWKNWSGLGSLPGIPDIIGVIPGGRMLLIEVKTERGRLSEKQKEFIEKAQKQGALAFVAKCIEDVINEGL